jgi:hypothetical protein
MGMNSLFTPGIVRATARSLGLEAARLDLHPQTHALVLTVLHRGRPLHIDVPTGRNFTRDEICDLLIGRPMSSCADPHGSSPPTIVGAPPL